MNRTTRLLSILSVLALTPIATAWAFGLHLNHSVSYPRGIWIDRGSFDMTQAHHRPYVLACAPDAAQRDIYVTRGYIAWGVTCDGAVALLKRVWAVAGDQWLVTDNGVRVNGELVPNTAPKKTDSLGRPMPIAAGGQVPDGHVLLLSEYSPRSFDGRYFGPTPITDLIGEVEPLWTESP